MLAADTDPDDEVFSDEDWDTFIALESDNVRRGVALALESQAINIISAPGPVTALLDIRFGGQESAAQLMAAAKRMRSSAGGTHQSLWSSQWTYAEDFPDEDV